MNEQPQRIQRKRTKGWRMPEGAVYVGRPTKWGNPFTVHRVDCSFGVGMCWTVRSPVSHHLHQDNPRAAAQKAVDLFRLHIGPMGSFEYDDDDLAALVRDLGGHDLACWCPLDQPCHADVLLEIANTLDPQ